MPGGAEPTDPTATLDAVATPERAVAVVGELVGTTVAFGPVAVGPRDMATATARGRVGRLTARRTGPGSGTVSVPADLDVTVLIGRREVPVDVRLVVRVDLTGRIAGDLVEVDVAPITPAHIDVDARTSGAGGVLLQRFADLDAEIRHHVGIHVTTIVTSPEAVAACRFPLPYGSPSHGEAAVDR